MTLLEFSFGPLFFSMFSFCVLLRSKIVTLTKLVKLLVSIPITFLVCFLYPLTKVYLTHSYYFFEDFYMFCLIASLGGVAINIVIYLINGVIYAKNN